MNVRMRTDNYKYNDDITIMTLNERRINNKAFMENYLEDAYMFVADEIPYKYEHELATMLIKEGDRYEVKDIEPYRLFIAYWGMNRTYGKRHSPLFYTFDLYELKYDEDKDALVTENGKVIINEDIFNDLSAIFYYILNITHRKEGTNDNS